MTQDELTRKLAGARVGAPMLISYESPRGWRRFEVTVIGIKETDEGRPKRVSLERGTAAWMFIQKAKTDEGVCWCLFQPNPYPIVELELVETRRRQPSGNQEAIAR